MFLLNRLGIDQILAPDPTVQQQEDEEDASIWAFPIDTGSNASDNETVSLLLLDSQPLSTLGDLSGAIKEDDLRGTEPLKAELAEEDKEEDKEEDENEEDSLAESGRRDRELQSNLEAKEEEVATMREEMAMREEKATMREEEIKEYQSKLDANEEEMANMKEEKATMREEEIKEYQSKLDANEEEMATMRAVIRHKTSIIEEDWQKMSRYWQQLLHYQQYIDKLKSRPYVDALESRLERAEIKLAESEAQRDRLHTPVTTKGLTPQRRFGKGSSLGARTPVTKTMKAKVSLARQYKKTTEGSKANRVYMARNPPSLTPTKKVFRSLENLAPLAHT